MGIFSDPRWCSEFRSDTGLPDGDKVVITSASRPHVRLDMEAPGIRSQDERARRLRIQRTLSGVLSELRAGYRRDGES